LRKHDLDITLCPTPPSQCPELHHSQAFRAGSQPVCYAGTGIAGISDLSLAFSGATLSSSRVTVHNFSVQYSAYPIEEEWNGRITVPFGGSLRTNVTPHVELKAHYREKCQPPPRPVPSKAAADGGL